MAPEPSAYREEYTGGEYSQKHPDWHMGDAPGKALDVLRGVLAVCDSLRGPRLRVADVGAGTGAVLDALMKKLKEVRPGIAVEPVGFELAPEALNLASKHFAHIPIRNKLFNVTEGPFDAAMFIDVLEHVENPWELLRIARKASSHLIVRQPLLASFGEFRHNNYTYQRDHWGHISYFNCRSFVDMTAACGWKPLAIDVKAPWELAGCPADARVSIKNRLLTRWNREQASFLLSGFYLNGAFC